MHVRKMAAGDAINDREVVIKYSIIVYFQFKFDIEIIDRVRITI